MRKQLILALLTTGILTAVSVLYAATMPQHPHEDSAHSGAIEGRVIDAEGRPISGARVHIVNVHRNPSGKVKYTPTNEKGEFVIKGLVPGVYEVYAGKEEDGYPDTYSAFHSVGPVNPPIVNVHEQQTTLGVIVYLGPKAAKLVGRVIDATSGKRIEHAQITLRRLDNPDYVYLTGTKNILKAKGQFEILVPPVPLTLEVSVPGYEDWHYRKAGSHSHEDALHLASDEIKELTIALRPVR